jgi:hypothetical protein
MASLTDDEVLFIRDYIGATTPPEDYELDDIYTRVGTPIKVAYAILNKRLADFLSVAASYSIVGVYQESSQANIDNLRQLLKDMEDKFPEVVDDGTGIPQGTLRVTRMTRYGRDR